MITVIIIELSTAIIHHIVQHSTYRDLRTIRLTGRAVISQKQVAKKKPLERELIQGRGNSAEAGTKHL